MKNILLATMLMLVVPAAGRAQTILFGGVGRGVDNRGEVIRIDQNTGAGILVVTGANDPDAGLTGLAFDASGQLFASTNNTLRGMLTVVCLGCVTPPVSSLATTGRLATSTISTPPLEGASSSISPTATNRPSGDHTV